jgi:hypothetical protein
MTRTVLRRGLGLTLLVASLLGGSLAPMGAASAPRPGTQRSVGAGISAQEAVNRATARARAWASDAILFAVVGVERAPAVPPTAPRPRPNKPEPAGRFPCGRIDDATWARFDPAWGGESDNAVGDGRMAAWQVVFYSLAKNRGTSFLVRPGHRILCAADPLTAKDRAELRDVRAFRWTTDSTEAIAAIRARYPAIDRALSRSRQTQVSYGVDLRKSNRWGIKGQVPDRGVTFSAEVGLTSLTVTNVTV